MTAVNGFQHRNLRVREIGHELYGPGDFTPEEMDRRNELAVAVCEGGLDVCKRCSAAGAELDEHEDCASYRRSRKDGRH